MPYDYQRPQVTFGFSSGFPRDVVVLIAVAVGYFGLEGFGYEWAGGGAMWAAAVLFAALIVWFALSTRSAGRAQAAETPPGS